MGLDLILYKRTKPAVEMSLEEELDSELAYGRKTWAIADFFTSRCEAVYPDSDFEFIVTKQDWDEFMDSLDKLNDPIFRERVENFVALSFDWDIGEVDDETAKNFAKDEYDLEAWLDGALNNDSPYQLGLDWELNAVLSWFDADPIVQKAFKDGIDVRLMQSY